jgi:hypothetical protein
MAIVVGSSTLGAFVQAIASELGKRTVESVPKTVYTFVLYVRRRWGRRRVSIQVTTQVGEVRTALEFNDNLPDEARLALLDLDFTKPELSGKVLHWNSQREIWEAKRSP